jgi:hypothetical protein
MATQQAPRRRVSFYLIPVPFGFDSVRLVVGSGGGRQARQRPHHRPADVRAQDAPGAAPRPPPARRFCSVLFLPEPSPSHQVRAPHHLIHATAIQTPHTLFCFHKIKVVSFSSDNVCDCTGANGRIASTTCEERGVESETIRSHRALFCFPPRQLLWANSGLIFDFEPARPCSWMRTLF